VNGCASCIKDTPTEPKVDGPGASKHACVRYEPSPSFSSLELLSWAVLLGTYLGATHETMTAVMVRICVCLDSPISNVLPPITIIWADTCTHPFLVHSMISSWVSSSGAAEASPRFILCGRMLDQLTCRDRQTTELPDTSASTDSRDRRDCPSRYTEKGPE
jgi:hypothetical protein